MKRVILLALVFIFVGALVPHAALAGVEPSPFRAPGLAQDMWTAPGQIVGFNPQPEPPGFSVQAQIRAFDPQPEPPGRLKGLWVAPGHMVGFDPQPEPPGYTPVMQVDVVLY